MPKARENAARIDRLMAGIAQKQSCDADLENPKENTDSKGDGIIQNCTKGRMHLNQSGGGVIIYCKIARERKALESGI